MAASTEVKTDIEESKQNKSVNVQVTDGKVVCQFSLYDGTKKDYESKWINYPKVFDDWAGFTEYATEFFKE